ncbi:MAG: sugar phosphate nucleotidyltransferase [Oscillospiraceae bacterium]|nr:sugar phosphate nucleotidyltransferase [Oscillospiraceae bacterium]
MTYDEFMIDGGATVEDGMKKLQSSGHKILFIAPDDRLEAVFTDGDVRRYMLADGDLCAPIRAAAVEHPLCVRGFHEAAARALLAERDISCCPMLDESGRIHALVFRDVTVHRPQHAIDAPVVIMAGGFGTRLLPYTEILPKPLMPVGNLTITEHILNRFKKFGCRRFSLVVNYKKNLIKSYFSEVDTGAEIEFVDEEKPLGTGGGLCFFRGRFGGPFFVTNCDSVVEADYGKILRSHTETNSILTMVCAKKVMSVPYGVVETDGAGAMTAFREKPSYEFLTNTGFYVVSPEFLDYIPDNEFTPITEAIARCRTAGKRVNIYSIEEECFVDVGQLDDLRSVEDKLR